MEKAKRFLTMIIAAMMIFGLLAGCGTKDADQTEAPAGTTAAPAETKQGEAATKATESTIEGKIEGEAATEMVDKVIIRSGATSEDPSPFAPSVGGIVKNLLYARPIQRNSFGALLDNCKMWLAKSVEKVDDFTYDIELYDYITDNKGNKIDADDVIFSYQMSFEKGHYSRIGSSMDKLEKTGDYSLRMTLKTNAPGTIEDLLSNNQLDIVDQGWYESTSEEDRRKDPATTGPYRLVSETPGSSIVLEAVENYWQTDKDLLPEAGFQNVKTIEFKVITEDAMGVIAMQNHEVDVARFGDSTSLGNFYKNGETVEGYNVDLTPGIYTYNMFLNMSEHSVLSKSVDLRKAVLYALNSEDLMYAAGNDENTSFVLKSLGSPAMAGAQDKWLEEDYYDYNPEVAAEYLEKAGYKPGEVTLTFLSGTGTADSVRSVVMNNLEEAGFKCELVTADTALFNTYKTDGTQWDLFMEFKGTGTGHITGVWTNCFNPDSYTDGTSICLIRDDKLVELLNAAGADPSDANMDAFHNYLRDQAYVKGLYSVRSAMISTDKVLEITLDGMCNPMPNAFVYAADYASGK